MTIGTLSSRVVLDQPGRIHCGTADEVTGNVVVTYRPSHATDVELFGPLTVTVTFHGRAKTKIKIRHSNGSGGGSTAIYRGRVPLFATTINLFNGPFRSPSGSSQSFPFTLRFPAHPDSLYQADWEDDARYESHSLPPTMSMHHSGGRSFDCFNEYRIGCEARMAGIDVKIVSVEEDLEPHVLYEQPRVPPYAVLSTQHPSVPEHYTIQNEYLLPEDDRPHGFKAKAKAMFKSDFYPRYDFSLVFSAPCNAYIGEPLLFYAELRDPPRGTSNTAVVVPEITLQGFSVSIKAHTQVRASRGQLWSTEKESYASQECFISAHGQGSGSPFTKANEYRQVIRSATLTDTPSTFSTTNILRTYTVKVRFVLVGAEKQFSFKNEYPLVIHPPIEGGTVVADPSAANPRPNLLPYPQEE